MPDHADAGIAGQYALQTPGGFSGAIGYNNHAGVLRIAYPHAAAVVYTHPTRARGCVDQGIEQWPIGDGVRPVAHALGLAEGAGDAACVQVVAADYNRSLQFAG